MSKADTLVGLRILAERHSTPEKRAKAAERLKKLEAARAAAKPKKS